MDTKLKALKVVDLKAILADANVSTPAKANKQELISRILNNQSALEVYNKKHGSSVQRDGSTTIPKQSKTEAEAPAEKPPSTSVAPPPTPSVLSAAVTETPPAPISAEDTEVEKRKRRAARFGIPLVDPQTSTATQKTDKPIDDPQKLEARAARFSLSTDRTSKKRPTPIEQIDPEEAEKRRKRALRFGTSSVESNLSIFFFMCLIFCCVQDAKA